MSLTVADPPAFHTANYPMVEDAVLFRRFRTWWTVLCLFLMAQGNGLFTDSQKFQYTMKWVKQVAHGSQHDLLPLTISMVLICIGLMLGHTRPALRLMLRQKELLAFPVLAFASAMWSEAPLLTLRKAALLTLSFAFAWFIATYYSPPDQMRIILAAGVVVGVASSAMAILLPQYGLSWAGEWKGVFTQKNHMGIGLFMMFAALPFCRLSSRRDLQALLRHAVLPLILILLTRSRTAWFLVITVIALRVWLPCLIRTSRDKIPFMLYSLLLTITALAGCLGLLLSLLGRDLTFSGRTHEWAVIAPFTLTHFWLGYGYQAFWLGDVGDSGTVAHLIGGQNVADNGYLDSMLQFGFVGMVLLVIVLVASVRDFRTLVLTRYVPITAFWYASLILTILLGSFSESLLWESTRIEAFMLVLACAGLRTLATELAKDAPGSKVDNSYPY